MFVLHLRKTGPKMTKLVMEEPDGGTPRPDANMTVIFLFVFFLILIWLSHLLSRMYFSTSGSGFAELGFLVFILFFGCLGMIWLDRGTQG